MIKVKAFRSKSGWWWCIIGIDNVKKGMSNNDWCQSLLCVWDLFFRYWVPVKKKNSHIYALVEISFTVSWIQSLYDVESIQGFGRLGVATACCTFIGRNDLSYCHRAILALNMIHCITCHLRYDRYWSFFGVIVHKTVAICR